MKFKQYEVSFVVGAMAAMASQTGKVAFMGGMDNTVLDDFYVGFANGAKYVNPEIKVNCSWMNSFNDVTAGKDVATGLYEAGYDVVFACGGQAGLGGFDAVIEKGEGNAQLGLDGGFVSASVTDTTNAVFTADQMATINSLIADIIAGKIDCGTAFGQAEGWFKTFVESNQ